MSTLATLRETRHAAFVALEAIYEKCEQEDRGFEGDEKRDFDELTAKVESLDERIAVAEKIATCSLGKTDEELEAEDRADFEAKRVPGGKRKFNEEERCKIFAAWCAGEDRANDECLSLAKAAKVNVRSNELRFAFNDKLGRVDSESRDLTTQTTTLGGDAVPTEMLREIERAMQQFGNVRAVARILSTAGGGPLEMPTVTDVANAGSILAENVADDETDPTFGQATLNAYKVTSDIVNISFEMLQDGVVDVGALIGDMLGERIARGENALLTTGTGTGQHNGIVTAAANSSVTLAASVTLDNLIDLEHTIDPAYRSNGASWMFNDTILKQIKNIQDDNSRPMFLPDNLQSGAPRSLVGYPYSINQDMASGTTAKAMIFGLMSKFYVRSVREVVLRRSDDWNFDQFQTSYVAYIRSDSEIIQSAAIKYATVT